MTYQARLRWRAQARRKTHTGFMRSIVFLETEAEILKNWETGRGEYSSSEAEGWNSPQSSTSLVCKRSQAELGEVKWSYLTSKEEIIYLIKVFPPLSPSANQNSSARERLSRSKEHSRILPDKCRRGRGEWGQRREGERDIANPLHIITAWSCFSLPTAPQLSPYPSTCLYRQIHTGRAWSPRGI